MGLSILTPRICRERARPAGYFWSLTALVLLLPWHHLGPAISNSLAPRFRRDAQGVEMTVNAPGEMIQQAALWVRFVVYPLIIIFVTIMFMSRTAAATNQMLASARSEV